MSCDSRRSSSSAGIGGGLVMEAYWAYVWKRLSVCGIRLASLYPLIDDILYIPASQASGPAAGAEPTRFQ